MVKKATHINVGGPHKTADGTMVLHGDTCSPTERELASFGDKFAVIGVDADAGSGSDFKIGKLEAFLAKSHDVAQIEGWYEDDDRKSAAVHYQNRLEELE